MEWAEKYIGIPFLDMGRDESGCDCWGLARLIWNTEKGLRLPDNSTYNGSEDGGKISAQIEAETIAGWIEIPRDEVKPFDGVLMSGIVKVAGVRRRFPMHIGVVIEPGLLIHVEKGIGTSIARYNSDTRVRNRIIGFYRPR